MPQQLLRTAHMSSACLSILCHAFLDEHMVGRRRQCSRRELQACARAHQPPAQEKQLDGEKKAAKQKLILGTHTSEGEQNYLMIAEVALPTVDNEAEAGQYDEERGEVGGFGAATGRVQVGLSMCHSCE